MLVIILISLFLIVRVLHVYFFIKKISKICYAYDWKYIDEHGDPLLDVLADEKGYHLTAEWSAYNFLFLKGPSPFSFFFSLKPLTIKSQYSPEAVEKLKKYELIN